MSSVIAAPQLLATAAADLADIGTTVSEANGAAAAVTTGLLPAAQDEVSEAVAALFGGYAQEYHALTAQAAEFHERLVQTLGASAGSYAAAEGANVTALLQTARQDIVNAVNTTSESLLGRSLIATGTGASSVTGSAVVNAADQLANVATTLVMGGTGQQIPTASFLNIVNNLFLQPNLSGTSPLGLNTPEQFYPFGNVKQLTLSASVSQGVQILDNALQPYISSGTPVGVFGYSQSAVIASLEMKALQAAGVPSSDVHFVLIGDLMNPNGGIFERFAGLNMTALGIDFYGSTPSNAYPTTIYTMEYDGWADFPEYPLNILSDLNAFASTTHFDYTSLTTTQVQNAIHLATSGATQTNYYVITTDSLPLLNGVRNIPIIGNPIADLLQPDLTYLVNMGYGNPLYGWSTSPANIPTQFGLFPSLSAHEELLGLLGPGAQQGIHDFIGDFTGTGPHPVTLTSVSSLLHSSSATGGLAGALTNPATTLTALSELTPASLITNLQTAITNTANTISSTASNLYGALLPTADVINAAVVSVPAYDVNLFLDGIQQALNGQPVQGLANAVGRPIAATIVLYLWLGEIESAVISQAI